MVERWWGVEERGRWTVLPWPRVTTVTRFRYERVCLLLHNYLMRFHAFWAATRFPYEYEMVCFLALMRFPNGIYHTFRPPMRFPDEILCSLLHNFLMRLPYEIDFLMRLTSL
jgi:hypothetical protein